MARPSSLAVLPSVAHPRGAGSLARERSRPLPPAREPQALDAFVDDWLKAGGHCPCHCISIHGPPGIGKATVLGRLLGLVMDVRRVNLQAAPRPARGAGTASPPAPSLSLFNHFTLSLSPLPPLASPPRAGARLSAARGWGGQVYKASVEAVENKTPYYPWKKIFAKILGVELSSKAQPRNRLTPPK